MNKIYVNNQTHSVHSLQGTLAKPAKPVLKPNFAKEPFSPSRSNAEQRDSAAKIKRLNNDLKNSQLVTATHSACLASGSLRLEIINLNNVNINKHKSTNAARNIATNRR